MAFAGTLTACVVLLVATSSALAGASATATVSNLAWELIDLDLTDGIEPAITITPFSISVVSFRDIDHTNGGAAGSSVSFTVHPSFGSGWGMAHATLLTEGMASVWNGGAPTISAFASMGTNQFTLTPMTAVRFTFDVEGQASTETGIGETSTAFASIGFSNSPSSSARVSVTATCIRDGVTGACAGGESMSFQQTLVGMTSNSTSAPLSIFYSVTAGASAMTVVPEPASGILWLLGLAGLSSIVRRRR